MGHFAMPMCRFKLGGRREVTAMVRFELGNNKWEYDYGLVRLGLYVMDRSHDSIFYWNTIVE